MRKSLCLIGAIMAFGGAAAVAEVADAHRAPYGDAHYIARQDAESQCGRGLTWYCAGITNGPTMTQAGIHSWWGITHIAEWGIWGSRYCTVYTLVTHWGVAGSNKTDCHG